MSELRSLEYVAFDVGHSRPAVPKVGPGAPVLKRRRGPCDVSATVFAPIGAFLLQSPRGAPRLQPEGASVASQAAIEQNLAREANSLVRDLMRADPRIYWLDLTLTSAALYGSLWVAVTSRNP